MKDTSMQDKINKIIDAIYKALTLNTQDYWIQEVYESYAIIAVSENGKYKFYKFPYLINSDGSATLGDMTEIEWGWTEVSKTALYFNNSLKAISKTDDELRVANYIALFGGRDATGVVHGANADGSLGEYFTAETEFDSDYTKTGVLYVDFEHGEDPDDMGLNSDVVLGVVDWKTAKKDDRGLFVERVLNRRQKYIEWIEPLIEEGLVGNSSQSIEGQATKNSHGAIIKWPLKRDTLTVNPMEPRMLSENAFQAIKNLSAIPAFKSLAEKNLPAAAGSDEPQQTETEQTINHSNTEDEMDEEVKALIEGINKLLAGIPALVTDATDKAVTAAMEKAKPDVLAGVDVTDDEADRAAKGNPFKSAGEFLKAVKTAALSPAETDKRLLAMKATGLGEDPDSNGGFLVQSDFSDGIRQNMWNTGSLLSLFRPIGVRGNGMNFNALDETSRADGSRGGGVLGYWLAEAGTLTGSKPKFRNIDLKLKKVAAMCYATDELLADYGALVGWINNYVPTELRFQVEAAIMNGNGVGKPLGILKSPGRLGIERLDAGLIQVEDVANMWAHRLPGASDYVWTINSLAFPQLIKMKIGDTPVYLPPTGVSGTQYGTLFGRPIIETEYNPLLGTEGDIMLISPSHYLMIDKDGVQSASSMHVAFLTDEMAFRFTYRCDGETENAAPIASYVSSSDYVSPFVTLSASS